MSSMLNTMKMSLPLFKSIVQPRQKLPTKVRPFVPTRLKFVYSPQEEQVLYPGIYFVVPDTLTVGEMLVLEKAVFEKLRLYRKNRVALDVPYSLAVKFHDQDQSSYIFNHFKFCRNGLYLEPQVRAFYTAPDSDLFRTCIVNPDYGCVLLLDQVTEVLQIAALSLGQIRGGRSPDVIAEAHRLTGECLTQPDPFTHYTSWPDHGLALPGSHLRGFTTEEGRQYIYGLLHCFYTAHTDLNDYCFWE